MYQITARDDYRNADGITTRHTITRRITPPPTYAPTLRVRWDDDRKLYRHAGTSEPIGRIDRVEALAKEWGVEIEVLS